ncbi:MAG: glycosyltransferase family 4 protein [Candidatus Bathyarchaeia archaeon]
MSKQVLVFAPQLKTLGGGEYVTLKMIECLKNLGLKVKLATFKPPKWSLLKDFFGYLPEVSWLPLCQQAENLPSYIRDLLTYTHLKARKKKWLLINAIANEMPIPSHISYIHALHFARPLIIPSSSEVGVSKKVVGARLRSKYLALSLKLSKDVLAASNFTASILYQLTGIQATIVYPPCKMLLYEPEGKHKIVITISRFSREKNLNLVLSIAKCLRDVKFMVVGGMSDAFYYEELCKEIKRRSLNNVHMIPNPPRRIYEDLVSRSMVCLHTTLYDSFPISLVEALSAGAVLVVHKSGGPWKDILKERQGLYGYAYQSVDEAVSYINGLISDEKLYREIAERAYKRAYAFSENKFKQRFSSIVLRHLK